MIADDLQSAVQYVPPDLSGLDAVQTTRPPSRPARCWGQPVATPAALAGALGGGASAVSPAATAMGKAARELHRAHRAAGKDSGQAQRPGSPAAQAGNPLVPARAARRLVRALQAILRLVKPAGQPELKGKRPRRCLDQRRRPLWHVQRTAVRHQPSAAGRSVSGPDEWQRAESDRHPQRHQDRRLFRAGPGCSWPASRRPRPRAAAGG